MKGLLIKDFQLMKNQGKILFAILIVIAIFTIAIGSNPGFMAAYVTVFLSMFTTSTISYDEYDSGYLFLFTLPVNRNGYVKEKYLFGIISVLFGWCIGMAAGTAVFLREVSSGNLEEWFFSSTIYIAVAVIFLSFMIPMRLRFEAEKSRYANFIVIIALIILYMLIRGSAGYLPDTWKEGLSIFFTEMGNTGIWLCIMTAALTVLIFSYFYSRHIVRSKQF